MSTSIGTEDTLGDLLNSLIELNHDCISAYEAALKRVEREDLRVRLRAMVSTLRRHLDELKPHVEAMTTNVSDSASPKEVLTKGRVILAGLFSDATILGALRTNLRDMVLGLQRAVGFEGHTPQTRAMLQRHLQTESEHLDWLDMHVDRKNQPQAADEVEATMKQRTIARTDAKNATLKSSTDI